MPRSLLALLLAVTLSSSAVIAQDRSESKATGLAPAQRIIEIGQNDSQVQQHLDMLTNRIGPRLTASEGLQAACEWSLAKFKEMGLEARLEQWGEFPVGFERGPAFGSMVVPRKVNLEFGTNAWTAGTRGRVRAEVVIAPKSMEELEEMRDTLEGSYVLVERLPSRWRRRSQPSSENQAEEKSAQDADKPKPLTREEQLALREEILKCKPAGLIRSTRDQLILTGGNYRITMETLPTIPDITLVKTQWDEIQKLVKEGKEVQLEFDIRNHFRRGPIPLYNVIADIPGTEFPDQYVVVGGHLDSWDGATGATDNATGCATTIEAARLLMAAGAKPRRTIRFMLWTGEEQGLLGSRAWVEKHKDDVSQNASAVFVHDGGTNYVAGIRCTEAMKPYFEEIFAPVEKLNERAPFVITTVERIRPRGGSDHVPFIRAGVPGFFWVQRGVKSYRNTHHTQFDTFDSVVPEYQQHSSIVIAVAAYGTANLDALLTREGVQTE